MASLPADTSSPAASWGNEDRRSDFIRGPHLLLLLIPCNLYYLSLLHLLSISPHIFAAILPHPPTPVYIYTASHQALDTISSKSQELAVIEKLGSVNEQFDHSKYLGGMYGLPMNLQRIYGSLDIDVFVKRHKLWKAS